MSQFDEVWSTFADDELLDVGVQVGGIVGLFGCRIAGLETTVGDTHGDKVGFAQREVFLLVDHPHGVQQHMGG